MRSVRYTMDVQVKKYNSLVRELLDAIASDLHGNSVVKDIRRQFQSALVMDRTLIIEETSPEILQYRDIIAEDRWDELLNSTWQETLQQKGEALKMDNKSMSGMVTLLVDLWQGYDEEQQAYVKKSLKKLLSYCVKYHKAKLDGLV